VISGSEISDNYTIFPYFSQSSSRMGLRSRTL